MKLCNLRVIMNLNHPIPANNFFTQFFFKIFSHMKIYFKTSCLVCNNASFVIRGIFQKCYLTCKSLKNYLRNLNE